MNRILKLTIISLLTGIAFSFTSPEVKNPGDPEFLSVETHWVDSVYNSLSTDQKIAQLFMVAAYSNRDSNHVKEITKLIQQYKIGGLIFMQGGPVREAKLTNYYQSISKTPLMISIDGEWGLAMRLDSTISFPKQMTLGAIKNDSLIFEMGREVARQCKRIGITINFAPDIDINNNPKNPVIGVRSFGENRLKVAKKGSAYMKGMQYENVLTTGKHFPGHGDTDADSHFALPVINESRKRLDSLELYPFKQLIANGLSGIMVAHLQVPALEKNKNTPSTLSSAIITNLLREEMGFKGLIFTDALNMKGVTKSAKPGDIEYRALKAGNDVLLFSENVQIAIDKIKEGMAKGDIDSNEVFAHCRKILMAKKWMNLDSWKPIKIDSIYEDLHTKDALLLQRRLIEASITILKKKNNIIPLKRLDTLNIASLVIGEPKLNMFQKRLSSYTKVKHFNIAKTDSSVEPLLTKLKDYNLVIVHITKTSISAPKHFGISSQTTKLLGELVKAKNLILCIDGSPYSLEYIQHVDEYKGIVIAYEDNDLAMDYAAQAIFAGIKVNAKLPVSFPGKCTEGQGEQWDKATRLKYSIPEDVGLNSDTLKCIDELMDNAICEYATPGCQVLIARRNTIVFQKSYGTYTYDFKQAVQDTDLYDIASVTKIAASAPSLMKLSDQKLFNVMDPLCVYLPELDSSNKENLRIIDILTHQAGLKPWIPFYLSLIDGYDSTKSAVWSSKKSKKYSKYSGVAGVWLDTAFSFNKKALTNTCDSIHCFEVAKGLYIDKIWKDSLFNKIKRSSVSSKKEYNYSDLGYYFMQRIIEDRTKLRLDEYVQRAFYRPLGAYTTGFLPLQRFPKDQIVPTENDVVFRKQLLQGTVHDPGAAMLGGVAGHAGIFTTANDLAKLLQMYMNKGVYGGERYLSDSILTKFTSCPFYPYNHRGISFDKPGIHHTVGPVCYCVPPSSYGHTGFTGTIVWMDPDNQILYIFLSNRVNPDAENTKINKISLRQSIHQTIYNAL